MSQEQLNQVDEIYAEDPSWSIEEIIAMEEIAQSEDGIYDTVRVNEAYRSLKGAL